MAFGFKEVILLMGGLGLFLYGIKIMGDGLEMAAGSRLKKLLSMLTSNRILGVLVGFIVTGIIQSSSATTVMVVGFVNAGLMELAQAVSVIMGANIGTTVTSQLIAARIGEFGFSDIAPLAIFAGMCLIVFSKKSMTRHIGEILTGFGILFMGMEVMNSAMEPLKDVPEFTNFLVNFQHPLFGILTGMVFTAVIQSSSASVGILQALAMQGIIGLDGAIFVLCGQNIGTCITAILSSVGTNKNARRTAIVHLLFNVIGTVSFVVIVLLGVPLVGWIKSISPGNAAQQIANTHIIFNITTTLLLLPASGLLVKLSKLILPGEEKTMEPMTLRYLDERILATPSIAVAQVIRETERMAVLCRQNLHDAIDYFFHRDNERLERVRSNEQVLDYLSAEVTQYLIRISALPLSDADSRVIGSLFHAVNDFERIGDHAENIVEAAETLLSLKKGKISDTARQELKELSSRVELILDESLHMFRSRDYNQKLVDDVNRAEEEIDECTESFRNNHIKRLTKKKCTPEIGVIFLDMLTNLERVADHAVNVVDSVTA